MTCFALAACEKKKLRHVEYSIFIFKIPNSEFLAWNMAWCTKIIEFWSLFLTWFWILFFFLLFISCRFKITMQLCSSFLSFMAVSKKWTSRRCSSSCSNVYSISDTDGWGRRRPSTALSVASPGIFFFIWSRRSSSRIPGIPRSLCILSFIALHTISRACWCDPHERGSEGNGAGCRRSRRS